MDASRVAKAFAWLLAYAVAGTAQADCLDDAARFHGVDPLLLRSIALQESGMNPKATNRNANGSEDIGLMQINSIHLPRLAAYGITRKHLFDGCVSAYVGAWILRENIQRYGPTWNAVGAYNAASPEKRLRYANKIHTRWQKLQSAAIR
ncbi:lytic transglycosylase domain-containing protein [Cupriavidus sp. AU9028]|uniref:lytic transglycosylase domain-containing protein n=1 Tax=Cupriavidus sp. AU9028 TaxID=2871157 RepID=UPI001C968483|nr:lytic transglycosylase domain-containing protein [Cupriavidus sp. AU9028]MBY4898649.1 lytic transglycosylase domain-containing protein [Cupriavidus sp. AU9028]